jgi:hypothetical protein
MRDWIWLAALVAVLAVASTAAGGRAAPGRAEKGNCRPTLPNGHGPPGERRSAGHHANASRSVWTVLPPRGRLVLDLDGVKFPWWARRGRTLTIAGRSLDRRRLELRSRVNPGAPESAFTGSFWASAVFFPRPGCWSVTATADRARLTFVVLVVAPR